MALAKACADLRANAVRKFHLYREHIDNDSARALAEALQENRSLGTLMLMVWLLQCWRRAQC